MSIKRRLTPDEALSYRIVECGVNTDVYNDVKVNNGNVAVSEDAVSGGEQGRYDYSIAYDTAKDRTRVKYSNQVDPDALRNLTVTKRLYDESGYQELHNDDASFNLRLYLAAEYNTDAELADSLADMQVYYMKDQNGNYCRWDSTQKSFVSIGKTDFSSLSEAEKKSVRFNTSMNGAITKIPPFYTVEIRNVLAGTRYRVEERPAEIPDGYSYRSYGNGTPIERNGVPGVEDNIELDNDSHVDVDNLKGWGLRVNKVWAVEN